MDYLFTLFVGIVLGTGAGWYLKGRFGSQVAAVKHDLGA
jgi:hypothetical protein